MHHSQEREAIKKHTHKEKDRNTNVHTSSTKVLEFLEEGKHTQCTCDHGCAPSYIMCKQVAAINQKENLYADCCNEISSVIISMIDNQSPCMTKHKRFKHTFLCNFECTWRMHSSAPLTIFYFCLKDPPVDDPKFSNLIFYHLFCSKVHTKG